MFPNIAATKSNLNNPISPQLTAPIIINTDTRKGAQIIVENDMPVKFMIYDLLKSKKEKAGE